MSEIGNGRIKAESAAAMKQHKVIGGPRSRKVPGLVEWRRGWLLALSAWNEFQTPNDTWKLSNFSVVDRVKTYTYTFNLVSKGGQSIEIGFEAAREFDGVFSWQGQSWRLQQRGAYSVLKDEEGNEAARVYEAWKDSDIVAGITHCLECVEGLDPFLAALPLGLAIGGIHAVDTS